MEQLRRSRKVWEGKEAVNTYYYLKGAYKGTVLDAALSKAGTGTPTVVIRFQVEPVERSGLESYSRTVYLPATEASMPYLAQKLEALGFMANSLSKVGELSGCVGEFYCRHEADQNGVVRERWDVVTGPKPLESKPVDPSELRRLDSLFSKARKANVVHLKPAVSQSKPDDDDVPF